MILFLKNNVQNHQISSDLEFNSRAMVSSITYSNVIVNNDNLHPIIPHDLKILQDF